MTRSASLAEHAWVGARERSDFAGFLPHLARNIELRRRYIECFEGFGGFEHPYDALLDDFEPGMRTARLAEILGALRDAIRPLVVEVAARDQVDDACLHGEFALDAQEALAQDVVRGLPLAADAWRLDPTVHPFATAISPGDLRITTRFDPGYIGTALWSVVHEAGHAMYENGFGDELDRTPLCAAPSLGFHESQSRLWENWVGRGRPYLELLHAAPRGAVRRPLRQVRRGGSLPGREPDRALADPGRGRPGHLQPARRPALRARGRAVRGADPARRAPRRLECPGAASTWGSRSPTTPSGVLQDVHWAGGAFGYFPTYSLGNLLAAQIWDAVTTDLPELDAQIAAGELEPLRDWLGERIYREGAKLMPERAGRAGGRRADRGRAVRAPAPRSRRRDLRDLEARAGGYRAGVERCINPMLIARYPITKLRKGRMPPNTPEAANAPLSVRAVPTPSGWSTAASAESPATEAGSALWR